MRCLHCTKKSDLTTTKANKDKQDIAGKHNVQYSTMQLGMLMTLEALQKSHEGAPQLLSVKRQHHHTFSATSLAFRNRQT